MNITKQKQTHRREWHDIFKVMKEKKTNKQPYNQEY